MHTGLSPPSQDGFRIELYSSRSSVNAFTFSQDGSRIELYSSRSSVNAFIYEKLARDCRPLVWEYDVLSREKKYQVIQSLMFRILCHQLAIYTHIHIHINFVQNY